MAKRAGLGAHKDVVEFFTVFSRTVGQMHHYICLEFQPQGGVVVAPTSDKGALWPC